MIPFWLSRFEHVWGILIMTWTEAKDTLQTIALIAAGIGAFYIAAKKAVLPIERQVVPPPPKPPDPDSTNPSPRPTATNETLWERFEKVYGAISDLSNDLRSRFDSVDGRLKNHDERFLRAEQDRGKQIRAIGAARDELGKLKNYVVQLEQNYQRERRSEGRGESDV